MAAQDFKWYVYELSEPDTGKVFYVGKGTKNRIDAHEAESAAGIVSHKCNKIRSVIQRCGKIGKTKVAYFNDEKSAYIHEANRIAEYGIDNLTNALFATTLVSNKTLVKDTGAHALQIIKFFGDKFASWLKATNAGEKKIDASGLGEFTSVVTEKFYNELCPKLLNKVIGSEKSKKQFAEIMRKHKIEIQYVAS